MEIKKSNSSKVANFIRENKTAILTTIVAVIVIILFIVIVCARVQAINNATSDKLNTATKLFGSGQIEQALSMMDDLMANYRSTPSAYRAMIMKSSYLINQKKYEDAEPILKEYIEKAKPCTVRPIGYPILISLYDNTNNTEQAITVSKEFLSKYSDNYLAPSVMENMARLYELLDNKEEAQKIYKDIVDKYFGTIYANRASDKLK